MRQNDPAKGHLKQIAAMRIRQNAFMSSSEHNLMKILENSPSLSNLEIAIDSKSPSQSTIQNSIQSSILKMTMMMMTLELAELEVDLLFEEVHQVELACLLPKSSSSGHNPSDLGFVDNIHDESPIRDDLVTTSCS